MGSIYKRGKIFWIKYKRDNKVWRESTKSTCYLKAKEQLIFREDIEKEAGQLLMNNIECLQKFKWNKSEQAYLDQNPHLVAFRPGYDMECYNMITKKFEYPIEIKTLKDRMRMPLHQKVSLIKNIGKIYIYNDGRFTKEYQSSFGIKK